MSLQSMLNVKERFKIILIVTCIVSTIGCGPDLPHDVADAYASLPNVVDFSYDVKPILSDKCFSCHGPDQNKLEAELRLDVESFAKKPLASDSKKYAVVQGNLNKSDLFHRILSINEDHKMPPPESNLVLNAYEKAILIRWIEDGAKYKPHWSFTKPNTDHTTGQEMTNIDGFIEEDLHKIGIDFNPEANRSLLLRRLSLDLTGLPPTLEDLDAFSNTDDEDFYEAQVDRLLASPHFGERQAVDWLDAARFADTHGYQSDRFRDVSPWRDWVIKSFNENLPYDEFLTWQLAGDLLPNATREQKIATAFLRLHPQNEEGGIIEEEFRVEYVSDRVNTVGTAFMGMTMGCAKCHDHKFDPISQKEYFEMFSFFNNVKEAGQISFDGAMPVPTLLLSTADTDSIVALLDRQIEEQEESLFSIESNVKNNSFDQWTNNKSYQNLSEHNLQSKVKAQFLLDGNLINASKKSETGSMKRQASNDEKPTFTDGYMKQGLLLDGDAWLDLGAIGTFNRSQPFTVGCWVNIPADIENGVIIHKGIGAALYGYKGFHIAIKDNQLEVLMAHNAPYNAILKQSRLPIPRNIWTHLALTYDGKSQANGLTLFVNGVAIEMETITDNLYKDITFDHITKDPVGVQLGARWRGKGIGGAAIDHITIFDSKISKLEALQLGNPKGWKAMVSTQPNDLSSRDKDLLFDYYITNESPSYNQKLNKIQSLHLAKNGMVDTIPELMVMDDMTEPRSSFVLDRGQYDQHKEKVKPNTPSSILPFGKNRPANRLGLAQWMLDPDNPLTARVAVNRIWQLYFGRGLVRTAEDFGNQGSLPENQPLLDWLANEFIKSEWDIKALHKKIVMSKTYRQSSFGTKESREKDPGNDLYSRGPSGRLTAEMIRDNVLAASGLLDPSIGGPSVYPYQPEGLWNIGSAYKYPESTRKDQYRRSLYTIWKRTVPHPTQATFDAPERSECIVRRQETNTPLQALALMNDQVYLDAAKKLAYDIQENGDFKSVFRKLTGRNPDANEKVILSEMYEDTYQKIVANPKKLAPWTRNKEYKNKANTDYAAVAASASVISTIINTDACIVKR